MSEYDTYKYSQRASIMQGTRWARDEEIMRATRRIRLSDQHSEIHSGLPVISNGDTVYLDDSDAHSLIIGSTGSKKTRLFAMPMLEIMRRAGESVVVTDPKGELYGLTAQAFEDSGYRVLVINLRDPLHSNGWNPLALARDYLNAGDLERACAIVNDFSASCIHDEPGRKSDPFWTQTARAMLQGLALMMVEGKQFFPDETVNLLTMRHLAENFKQDTSSYGDPGVLDVMEYYPRDCVAWSNIHVSMQGSERTFDNVKVSYEAPMQQLYLQKGLVAMLSHRDVDFNWLGQEKTVMFLIMPDEKTTLHGIVSLIIKQCYEQLIALAQRCAGNTLPQRVNFLLDEFSNLPQIPDMPAMISAARSRNIKFFLIIQGLYQLSSKYGPDDAQTIKGNCGNWVFLTSRELPLLNEISDLCGQNALTGEKLITTSQLQRLNKERGEALILLGRQYPYIAHLADISEYHLPERPPRPYPVLPVTRIPTRTIKEILEQADLPPRQTDSEQPTDDFLLTIARQLRGSPTTSEQRLQERRRREMMDLDDVDLPDFEDQDDLDGDGEEEEAGEEDSDGAGEEEDFEDGEDGDPQD